MAPAKSKKKKGKGKSKGKKDEEEEEVLLIKFFEIKKLRTAYLRQCKHFITLPNEQVLKKIERYHNLEFLSSNDEYLDKLIIDSCQMNCNDMYALSTSFQNFRYLKTLCLWNIQMDKGAFIAIDKFLSRHKFLEVFQFLYCNANVENSVYLASILRNTESLMDVTFDHNPLKGDGIVNLFLGMKENPNSKVKRLSLRYCEAYGDFCETLVPLLGENKTLTELDLCGNYIGQDGVMFIATALMNNNILEVLNLASNNIIDEQELYGRTLIGSLSSKNNLTTTGTGGLVSSNTNSNTNTNINNNSGNNDSSGDGGDSGDLTSSPSAATNSNTNNASVENNSNVSGDRGTDLDGSQQTSMDNNSKSKIGGSHNEIVITGVGGGGGGEDEEDNDTGPVTTSSLTYLADAISREESAMTYLDLRGNNIGNNGGEIMLQALRTRKAQLTAKKNASPVLICQVTERMSYDIFSKIFEINKFMIDQEKKKNGKKKKGKKEKK
ncbi:RNI-like protein [Neocallimastix lanati (nom. inval.)]|nr:RNI-like protein [Neocallimastix sp. JGI-2020a]